MCADKAETTATPYSARVAGDQHCSAPLPTGPPPPRPPLRAPGSSPEPCGGAVCPLDRPAHLPREALQKLGCHGPLGSHFSVCASAGPGDPGPPNSRSPASLTAGSRVIAWYSVGSLNLATPTGRACPDSPQTRLCSPGGPPSSTASMSTRRHGDEAVSGLPRGTGPSRVSAKLPWDLELEIATPWARALICREG